MNIRAGIFAVAITFAPAASFGQDSGDAMNGEAGKAFMSANQKMMESMQEMQPSGDADMDFVMMMIPHHQGAVDMAKVELKYGKDKKLRAMAKDIIASQEKEIAEMKSWQAKHGH
jgi:uncharacterized protein (DUF305 family)